VRCLAYEGKIGEVSPLIHKWSMNEDGSVGKSCLHPSIISLSGLVPSYSL